MPDFKTKFIKASPAEINLTPKKLLGGELKHFDLTVFVERTDSTPKFKMFAVKRHT